MKETKCRENTTVEPVFYGSTHVSSILNCDGKTLSDYERRGIVAPLRTTSGRRLFRQSDIDAAKAYRSRKRGG